MFKMDDFEVHEENTCVVFTKNNNKIASFYFDEDDYSAIKVALTKTYIKKNEALLPLYSSFDVYEGEEYVKFEFCDGVCGCMINSNTMIFYDNVHTNGINNFNLRFVINDDLRRILLKNSL